MQNLISKDNYMSEIKNNGNESKEVGSEVLYHVRDIRVDDVRRMWEIRNSPEMRTVSRNKEEIPFEEHDRWFKEKYFSSENNHTLVATDEKDNVIGYCRIDFNEKKNGYQISIAVDPIFHGKGLGRKLLNSSLTQYGVSADIFADIKETNEASIRLFVTSGFELMSKDEEYNQYIHKKEEVK